jgi:glycosyltransferase involved in cell wall biosynthesis
MNSETLIKFSILVPTLNEEKYIGILLGSLCKQTFKDFEVIVVDGSSQDHTREQVLSFQDRLNIQFVTAPKRGVSAQRNYAANKAKNEYLVFFDADVDPEPGFLEKVKNYVAKHEVDVLTSWNIPISEHLRDEFLYWINNWVCLEAVKHFSPGAVGTFIFVKKTAFEAVSGFCENFYFAEDYDLVKRIFDKGYKYALLRDPKIRVSIRRFEKEGRFKMIWKNIRAGYLYTKGGAHACNGKIEYEVGKF